MAYDGLYAVFESLERPAFLMTVTCRKGLSGKRSFISRSLTAVGRSGSCLQSEVLMASHTPCSIMSSFFPSPSPPPPPPPPPEECVSSFWLGNRTFLCKPGLTEGGNVNLVFTKFPRDEVGPPFGPRRGIPVEEGAHVPCAEDHLIFCCCCC